MNRLAEPDFRQLTDCAISALGANSVHRAHATVAGKFGDIGRGRPHSSEIGSTGLFFSYVVSYSALAASRSASSNSASVTLKSMAAS
jgi:hypothetical protein